MLRGILKGKLMTIVKKIGVLVTSGLILALALGVGSVHAQGPAPVREKEKATTPGDRTKPDMGMLKGRWLRPDGGYILTIRSVDGSGKMDASYHNPNPISVSRAEATWEGSAIKVFVELWGKGYPGSTYKLTYDPKSNELRGIYFQAALRQSFEVVFVKAD
jgi:hypothetical protein